VLKKLENNSVTRCHYGVLVGGSKGGRWVGVCKVGCKIVRSLSQVEGLGSWSGRLQIFKSKVVIAETQWSYTTIRFNMRASSYT
jgi:hypothetical protein